MPQVALASLAVVDLPVALVACCSQYSTGGGGEIAAKASSICSKNEQADFSSLHSAERPALAARVRASSSFALAN